MKPFRVPPVLGIVSSGGVGVMMHQERFEDACDEYDRVLPFHHHGQTSGGQVAGDDRARIAAEAEKVLEATGEKALDRIRT